MNSARDKACDDPASILSILHKWGVHTVGDFAALDKEDVSARLGSLGVKLWERATGRSVRLLQTIDPPETFEERFEFENEIETIDPLLFMLRRFLQQLTTRLHAIYLVAEELILQLSFSDRSHYRREFKIPQPNNDVDLLFRMLHTHLENFKSPHPITAVELSIRPAKPAPQQFGLFETALRNPMQLAETLARLVALLGRERVGTPVVEQTHRPDVFRIEPFQWTGGTRVVVSQTSASSAKNGDTEAVASAVPSRNNFSALRTAHATAALRRFRPAQSGSVLCEDDEPLHVRSAHVNGATAARCGPYLSSGDWWDRQRWLRCEWDLQLNNGAVVRAHRDDTGEWKVDGIYD